MLAILVAASLPVDLGKLADARLSIGVSVGLSVTTGAGKDVMGRHDRMRLVPASNQKLYSMAYALHTFGPNHRLETRFWKEDDAVVVDAEGDPGLSIEGLAGVRDQLGITGAETVKVRQPFAVVTPPSWEEDDRGYGYAARITALTLNGGVMTATYRGGQVVFEPNDPDIKVIFLPSDGTLNVDFDPKLKVMILSGKMPTEGENLGRFAIPQPDRLAAGVLGSGFEEAVIVPNRAPDAVIRSQTISELMTRCLQVSDNVIAEHLFLAAAAKSGPLGADPYTTAGRRMRDFYVKTVGGQERDFRPIDGSGMSRHNLVTAKGTTLLLNWALKQPTKKLWIDAMAKPGVGTLRTRLSGVDFAGKTGTLNSVSGLSGYVLDAKGEPKFVASILQNHYIDGNGGAQTFADNVIRRLAAASPQASALRPEPDSPRRYMLAAP